MSESNDSVEQTPLSIRGFSSQYGSNNVRNYSVVNICKNPSIYPLYGDSTDALVFRTYGPWWLNLPSYKETRKYFKRVENEFTSRDFIDIEYSNLVHQCLSLNIYETYNPGSLEVVYVGKEDENEGITWHRVWKFPEPFSIVLRNNQEIFIENGKIFILFGSIWSEILSVRFQKNTNSYNLFSCKSSVHHNRFLTHGFIDA
jgi:hypothetical protein